MATALSTPGIAEPIRAPWQGVSTDVKGFTGKQILVKGGLNWGVKKLPLTVQHGSKVLEVPRRYGIVRLDNDTVIGDVGEAYTPQSNDDLVSIGDAIAGEKAANYEAAGILRGGQQVWILMRIKGVLRVLDTDDTIERFMLLHNSFDGSTLVRFCTTTTRVHCANQLTTVEHYAETFTKARHTKNIGDKIAEIRAALRVVPQFWLDMQVKIDAMARQAMTRRSLDTYLTAVVGADPTAEKGKAKAAYDNLVDAFETSPGNGLPGVQGSLWAAFNAVTYFTTHQRTVRVSEGVSGEAEARWASLIAGSAGETNRRAWEAAVSRL